ncbi:PIN domain-containing protein [Elizabethkingia anophelis]|uniref:PIN domain-containing protein n=1 Tax=Elizabethkingia anophelis TaxID=1117645 RepID=UPI00259BC79F|nr:PIN domain-containing protein [Elizabethkingia anophelis]WJJ99754.1 PIN domain-containing protein [Elizabethkingia anophelis]
MVHIFFDCNIFLHYKNFEQINFNAILNSKDEYKLILAPVVVAELDKHKYNSNTKIARRAKKILPILEDKIKNGEVLYIRSQIKPETLELNNLNKLEQDDLIIASILEYKNELPEIQVVYISNDTGARLKSDALGITCLKLPDEYLLDDEVDPTEKENQKLQRELNTLKNLQPKIDLSFTDNKKFFIREANEAIRDLDSFLDVALESEYNKLPKLVSNVKSTGSKLQDVLTNYAGLNKEQVEKYNSNLDNYFEAYKNYLIKLHEQKSYDRNILRLDLEISNRGTCPGTDVDVFLTFPKNIRIKSEKHLKEIAWTKPKIPQKPINGFDMAYLINSYYAHGSHPFKTMGRSSFSVADSIINVHLNTIKHNQKYHLHPIFVEYDDIIEAEAFKIEYLITIGNLPNKIEGVLNISFERENI